MTYVQEPIKRPQSQEPKKKPRIEAIPNQANQNAVMEEKNLAKIPKQLLRSRIALWRC